jgi:hypothetical protein
VEAYRVEMLRIPHCLDSRLTDGDKAVSPTHLKYYMKILLGDFNVKVGKEDIFKLTIAKEGLCKIIAMIMELE